MSHDQINKKAQEEQNEKAAVKPDSETLHTTDPQEHMEGPISSIMQGIKDEAEDNNETKESADKKKDKAM